MWSACTTHRRDNDSTICGTAVIPYLRGEAPEGYSFVEYGSLITLGINTSFGLFLQAFKDGKVIYDPGDKATLENGKWIPHARSQFRINLNDIDAIYQETRKVDLRDPESY
ncbi:MvaI/BcnI family restriction endonuclease [Bifidobacterium magnum]|uniref:MvaI/BcnI family restriction endonuclease n=1 Tax=Bifidobacterium magnum TaxID=1692 RepID=UPI001EE6749E|nr:MvaI/BcnI family restriction endonuclease [Bifidobacterium magnum]